MTDFASHKERQKYKPALRAIEQRKRMNDCEGSVCIDCCLKLCDPTVVGVALCSR
jgi:hypothetical protein